MLFDFIGKTFGEDRNVPEYGDPPDFKAGIIVDGGICYMQFLKKIFIPCYARSEWVRKGLSISPNLNDPAQRCSDCQSKTRKKKHRCKKRKRDCPPEQAPVSKPLCPKSCKSKGSKCRPPLPTEPISTPASSCTVAPKSSLPQVLPPPPPPSSVAISEEEEKKEPKHDIVVCETIKCPNCCCGKTILICESCHTCHKSICKEKKK